MFWNLLTIINQPLEEIKKDWFKNNVIGKTIAIWLMNDGLKRNASSLLEEDEVSAAYASYGRIVMVGVMWILEYYHRQK